MKVHDPRWNGSHTHRLLEVVVVAIHTVVAVGPKSNSCLWCSLPLLWEEWWAKWMHPAVGLFHLTVAVHQTYHFGVFAKLSDDGRAYFFVYCSCSPLFSCRVVDCLLVLVQQFCFVDFLTWLVSFEIQYLQALKILGDPNHHILQVMREGNVRLGWHRCHLWSLV